MPTSLTLDTAHGKDGAPVLLAVGEIDLSNIDAFDRALSAATDEVASGGRKLTVDLSAVEYLDSAAINALFTHAEHIHLIAHPLLMSILSMCGLTELVSTEPAAAGH
ncbi:MULTISPECIES: STAS domain-containing protein [Mycobacterium]|jgi:anti-anti-sigma factor|uniref:Anti-anti-sigma factor n=1 Tax=Mycobacterium gordonae TaxID=1778 RepID=A0A1A6BKQ7_MYCGO|nr:MULTISPECIES: STAS domain-containing protein [Mycobacterium]MBX9979568.1 STAS domain-containing protein [Mycobacterium gordonae]MCQ4361769.1 STAS domain-containing protein [Mycobacterium gordonae]MCV7009250.1 STAS domain-containing protein [Mycobacterium gordonae]OBS02918.1 anti-anti-sigma factor [Mycobacterium gordonae]ODR21106.1 anti-anti-sigma factor [Mycobacterium gordonae]